MNKNNRLLILSTVVMTAALHLAGCGSSTSSTASDSAGTGYNVGGTVTGLNGTVVLQDNRGDDTLTVTANGKFTFALKVASTSGYVVSVLTQPLGETCSVANGTGHASSKAITNVIVTCSTVTYTVGGTVTGLNGTVVLQDNGGDDKTISTNSLYTFATALAFGSPYTVIVSTQPTGQTCTVTNATGTILADVTNVNINCTDNKIIFATAGTSVGNFGGISGVDSFCATDANYPGTGTYKALIIDGSTRVACTTANCSGGTAEHKDWVLASNTSYSRADGITIIGITNANGIFDFTGGLTNSWNNQSLTGWTGLATDWTSSGSNCTNWTDGTIASLGAIGNTNTTDSTAINNGSASGCQLPMNVICVQQ